MHVRMETNILIKIKLKMKDIGKSFGVIDIKDNERKLFTLVDHKQRRTKIYQ